MLTTYDIKFDNTIRPSHLSGQKLTSIELADLMGMIQDIADEDYPGNGIRLNISQERMRLSQEEESLLEFREGMEYSEWSREEKIAFIKSRISAYLR